MTYKLKTAPGSEPVTLAEAKAHAVVLHTADDTLITSLIIAAREEAENLLNRSLITQTWELILDQFPVGAAIELPLASPLASVTSVEYYDENNSTQSLATSVWSADTFAEPGRVYLNDGESWPETFVRFDAVKLTYVAGWSSAAAVPESIKLWIKARVSSLYEQRETLVVGASVAPLPAGFTESLLGRYMLPRIED